MTKRLLAAAALTLGLSAVAQAETLSADGSQHVAPSKSAGIRAAKYSGGEGTSWKAGRDT